MSFLTLRGAQHFVAADSHVSPHAGAQKVGYAHGAAFRPIVLQTGSGIQAAPIDSPTLSSGECWEGSQLLELDLKPGYFPSQVTLQDHIVALVADCAMDTTINDGRNRFTIHSGDIFLRSQQELCQLNWSGCLRLYVLVIDHWHMLRITNGVLASSDCLFAPTFGLRDGEIAQTLGDLRNRLKMRGCVEKSYGEGYTNQIAWQALRRSGRLPLHALDYKDPLSVSAFEVRTRFRLCARRRALSALRRPC